MTTSAMGPQPGDDAATAIRALALSEPERVLLEIGERHITARELDSAAESLATRLVRDLVTDNDDHPAVGLRTEGAEELMTAILAVQRAGLISVSLDPGAPLERVARILADVGAQLLLSDVPGDAALPIPVARPLQHTAEPGAVPLQRSPGPVIGVQYTSGSTGVPKGVIQRAELRPRVGDATFAAFAALGAESAGLRAGVLFAGSAGWVTGLLTGLLVAQATLVVYELRRRGLGAFPDWLDREHIGGFVAVPTVLREALGAAPADQVFPDLRTVLLNGETMTWEDAERLRRHLSAEALVLNLYGTTETGFLTVMPITADTPIGAGRMPVGYPLPGRTVRIVDDEGHPVPEGEMGEIVVEDAESPGYWQRPEETAAVFGRTVVGVRQIRTGDLGRLRPDGMVEHFGRRDHVVKVAGNRVELGDVEAGLLVLDGVAGAGATTRIDAAGDVRLVAYVEANAGQTLDARSLRAELARSLPRAALPDRVHVLDALPRLGGGKVDRIALSRMASAETPPVAHPPSKNVAEELAAIWCDVLGVSSVAPDDNFFDLGGDSLRAARVFSELERRPGVDRPVTLVLETPTLAGLTAAVEASTKEWEVLIPLRTAGEGPVLFMVHGGMGDVLWAGPLAETLPQLRAYAFRPPALSGRPGPDRSLHELADRYLVEVERVHPNGDVILYGYSLGGVIAVELALRLQARGRTVRVLALGDANAPGTWTGPDSKESLWRRGRRRFVELRALPAAEGAQQVRRLARHQRDHIELLLRPSLQRSNEAAIRAILARAATGGEAVPQSLRGDFVLHHYGPMVLSQEMSGRVQGDLLLLRADGPREVPDRGWATHVSGRVRVVDLPGTHVQLGSDGHAAMVGRAIADELNGDDRTLRHPTF